MNILVYGAGVLGSLYGYRLQQAGHEVTFLARGQRLADLLDRGLELQDLVTGERLSAPARVIDHLEPGGAYDLALVIMGYNKIPGVLPALQANTAIPTVLFMGNNAAGPGELVRALGPDRVMMGFPLASGTIRDGVVHFAAELNGRHSRAVIGEIDGAVTPRAEEIAGVLASAGFDVEISPDIDAWLKSHAAVILPLAGMFYGAENDALRLARTRDALVLGVRAVREGIDVLQARGYPVLPSRTEAAFRMVPEPLLVLFLSRLLLRPEMQYALVHAEHSREELRELAVHFMVLAAPTRLPTPALDCICSLLDPSKPPLPDGSRTLSLHWRRTAGFALALAGLIAGLFLVRQGKK